MATAIRLCDEVNTCDCCGRTGLKRTVLMRLDDGSLAYFGATCAARNTGKDQRQIKREIMQSLNESIGRASNELRFSEEARALREYRLTAPWLTIGMDAYEASPQNQAFLRLKQQLSAKHGVPVGSF